MLKFILDIIFPRRCVGCKKIGPFICSNCFATISFNTIPICPICNRNSIDGATHPFCKTRYTLDGLSSGVVYKGVTRKLVYQLKYKPYVSKLTEIIVALFYEALIQNEVFYRILEKKPIVVAVPLYKSRERRRGYNHASLIGKQIAEKLSLKFVDNVLIRIRDTKPQFKLKREERLKNINGAFAINRQNKNRIEGRNLLLVDDLATTCVTLNECANVLKRNGAKLVWGVTFAREE